MVIKGSISLKGLTGWISYKHFFLFPKTVILCQEIWCSFGNYV